MAAATGSQSSAIEVILVDCKIALINALDSALPTAQTQQGSNGLNQRDRSCCSAALGNRELRESVSSGSQSTRRRSEIMGPAYRTCILLILSGIPIPHARRFIARWADHHLHPGQGVSSYVEGAHAKPKLELISMKNCENFTKLQATTGNSAVVLLQTCLQP